MDAESLSILTEEKLLNEFDNVVENYGGIPRELWHHDCPKSLRDEIDALPKCVAFEECGNGKVRLENGDIIDDLRHLDFITVDPRTCNDMDDAICCEIDYNGDYVVYTAIANVPRYFQMPDDISEIEKRDTIGKVYLSGGYTIYSPFKAYSILPEQLSNNLCSLKEGEDRLAFVTKIVIDKNTGMQKGDATILEGVIKSRAKLSYNQAQAIVDDNNLAFEQNLNLSKEVIWQVLLAQRVADKIQEAFFNRGMIRFPEEKERHISLNNGRINVEMEARLPYQDVIKAFMIMTNEANAKFAQKNNIDVIYRTHYCPTQNGNQEDLKSFIRLLGEMPLTNFREEIGLSDEITPGTFNRIFDIVNSKNGAKNEVYKRFLTRIQARAQSSVLLLEEKCSDQIDGKEYIYSHFGLQSKSYLHITSPIRRVTDYVNMKNILAFVQGKKPLSRFFVEQVATLADEQRVKVDKSEEDFMQVLASHYYSDGCLVNATLCDFDYCRDGYCIFEDEETGFKINIPIETFSHGLHIDKEKWGFLVDGEIVAMLGQEKEIMVYSIDEKLVAGEIVSIGKGNDEDLCNFRSCQSRKLIKQKIKMRNRQFRFDKDFYFDERE